MARNLVVGYGEIGKAVGAVIGDHDWIDKDSNTAKGKYDMLHVCFPYTEDFVESVKAYIKKYKISHTVIYSTVQIGTTQQIKGAVHSPVEGKHPELEMSIRFMERWVGYNEKSSKMVYRNFFDSVGLKVKMIEDSSTTEALKLLSTTEYGINIEFARYKRYIAKQLGIDYDLMKRWNEDYNKLYRDLGMSLRFQKFVLDAPRGKKGGHCVTPNARLLHEQFPSEFTKIVGEL